MPNNLTLTGAVYSAFGKFKLSLSAVRQRMP